MKLNDAMSNAMREHKPEYKAQYKGLVRYQFGRMVEGHSESLEGIYNDKKWREAFSYTVRPNLDHVWAVDTEFHKAGEIITSYNPHDVNLTRWVINEDRLEKNAEEYAEAATLQWYTKMMQKLVDLNDVIVHHMNGGNLLITGKRQGHEVRIDQQIIVKCSNRGTYFNQFPARIYVDGKFTPEEDYKKMLGITVSKEPKTLNECRSCGYTGRQGEFRDPRRVCLVCPKCKSVAVYRIANPKYEEVK